MALLIDVIGYYMLLSHDPNRDLSIVYIIIFQLLVFLNTFWYNRYLVTQNLRANFSSFKQVRDIFQALSIFMIGMIPMFLSNTRPFDLKTYLPISLLNGSQIAFVGIVTVDIMVMNKYFDKKDRHNFFIEVSNCNY